MATLIGWALVYGPKAVAWVSMNAHWLIPMGYGALKVIKDMFG